MDTDYKDKVMPASSFNAIDRDYLFEIEDDCAYLTELSDLELCRVANNAANKDQEAARNYLIAKHKKLINGCIYEKMLKCPPGSIDADALYQCGRIGIFEAMKKYSADGRASFTTYAAYYIKNQMNKYISEVFDIIHIPDDVKRNIREISKYQKENPGKTRSQVIASLLKDGVLESEEAYSKAELYSSIFSVESLDKVQDEDVDFGKKHADTNAANPEREVLNEELIDRINKTVMDLPDTERSVAKMLYGFEGGKVYSPSEVAKRLGITSSAVLKIDSELRNQVLKGKLKDFAE